MAESGNELQTKSRKLADFSNIIIVGGTIQDKPRFITTRTMDSIRKSKEARVDTN